MWSFDLIGQLQAAFREIQDESCGLQIDLQTAT